MVKVKEDIKVESSILVDAKITTYEPTIDADQFIYEAQNGKYQQHKNYAGETDIHVDEYTNNTGVIGYMIRSYCDDAGVKKVKIVDKGNGGFDTGGWKVDA